MCMFCAAIPFTAALGASAQAGQTQKKREEQAQGKPESKPSVPAGMATGIAVALLVTGSIIVHTRL